jgi:phage terminase large subunit GpA-like protein
MSAEFRTAVSPPSDLHPAEWAALHVPVENSERSGMFDPSQTRWLVKPMGCMGDYVTRHMVMLFPTGAGKSTFFEAITCWIVSESPGSTLYASQTDSDAQLWAETRLIKSLRGCEPIKPLWPSQLRNSVRKDAIVWPHMFQLFGGANMSNFQEKSITFGLGDEAWKWKHGMVREWLGRSHNRENRKFVLASQAGEIATEDGIGQTSELHLEHDKCRKWDFAWQCPSCGSVHPFKFEQLAWDEIKRENGTPDDQATADTVRRICPNEECKAEFADTPANRRLLHDSYQENDGYLLTDDNGLRGYEGFHLDAGGIWWIPWAEDVLQKIVADRQMAIGDHTQLKQWFQKRRAIGWNESQGVKTITIRQSGYTRSDYEEARKIDNEKMRFCTIDAGGDHFWLAIRAWAEGGDSRLLYCGYEPSEAQCEEKRLIYGVLPDLTFLDVGFDQERMAGIITTYGWQGIKGDGNRKSGWEWEIKAGPKRGQKETRLYSRPWHAKAKNGARAKCWHVSTTQLQYILQRLIDGQGAEWLAYDDAPPAYAKQLNGERLMTKKDARGRDVEEWTRVGANHFRDTEVYSLAAALMYRVFAPVVD